MFGGLTKTSSRIAIAAALGLTLGGFAFKATPAQAADLGGDCCADLEERVAELEATTVRKGNKKVSVTLSGWVVKTMNYWDDGDINHFVVDDKGYDLGTRFAITGSATIYPGWSGGFNITVNTWGTVFSNGNQFNDLGPATGTVDQNGFGVDYGSIATLYSYIYIKSDTWGALNWGHLSPASDNPAVLADISGTVIESNAVFFEGAGFFLRPGGGGNLKAASVTELTWGNFLTCQGLGAGIGADCWGVAQPAVRYDSPTWGGFRFEASYGKNQLTGPSDRSVPQRRRQSRMTPRYRFRRYRGLLHGRLEQHQTVGRCGLYLDRDQRSHFRGVDCQVDESWTTRVLGGAAAKPTVPGRCQHHAQAFGSRHLRPCFSTRRPAIRFVTYSIDDAGDTEFFGVPDSDVWYVKPFWRKTWGAANGVGLGTLGATTFYGEYGQYDDQFAGLVAWTWRIIGICPGLRRHGRRFVTGSEVQRWGLGVVQEIDAAAMHLWLRWQHQELDVDLKASTSRTILRTLAVNQNFDDWDLFQAGGIIFF